MDSNFWVDKIDFPSSLKSLKRLFYQIFCVTMKKNGLWVVKIRVHWGSKRFLFFLKAGETTEIYKLFVFSTKYTDYSTH